jgi:hypothetical protein
VDPCPSLRFGNAEILFLIMSHLQWQTEAERRKAWDLSERIANHIHSKLTWHKFYECNGTKGKCVKCWGKIK